MKFTKVGTSTMRHRRRRPAMKQYTYLAIGRCRHGRSFWRLLFSLSANSNGFSNLTRKLLIEKIKGFFDRFEIQIIELYHNNKCAKRVAWITIFLGLMKNSRKRKKTNGSAVYSFSLKYFSIFKTKKKIKNYWQYRRRFITNLFCLHMFWVLKIYWLTVYVYIFAEDLKKNARPCWWK